MKKYFIMNLSKYVKNVFPILVVLCCLSLAVQRNSHAEVTETQTTVDIHQGITTDSTDWYANGTQSIHKWKQGTGFDQEPDISRTNLVSDDMDFSILGINHWAEPSVYNGYMYTVAKNYVSCGLSTNHYLAKYNALDLSYVGKVPIGDGLSFQVSAGPVIKNIDGTDYFFLLKCGLNADTIYKFRLSDGKYCNGTSCSSGDIKLTGSIPGNPQGLFQDKAGNWLAMSTSMGLYLFDSYGVFQRRLFQASWYMASSVVHEGFYLDDNNNLTMAMTYYYPSAPTVTKVLHCNLDTDIYRYVDAVNGSSAGTGYTPDDALDTLDRAKPIILPGMTLLIKGFGSTSPLRPLPETAGPGTEGYPITYEGNGEYVYVTGSVDFSQEVVDTEWTESQAAGEYYLTTDSCLQKTLIAVTSLATSFPADWTAFGMDGLVLRSKGTLGALSAGEWAWGDNDNLGFNTLYYKPYIGENMANVHIEANQYNPIQIGRNYETLRYFKVFFGDTFGIRVTGTGCSIEESRVRFGGADGIEIKGLNTMIRNTIVYDSQRGFNVLNTANNVSLYNNVAYNNTNEGFSINASAQSVTIKNCTSSENAEYQFNLSGNMSPSFTAKYNNWFGANNTFFNDYISLYNVGNLDNLNPQFIDVTNRDFHLSQCSPLVDAGDPSDDYSLEPDPNGWRINMGAYGNTFEAEVSPDPTDTDRDTIVDVCDNCTLVANPSQCDTNGDGYGNICDPDLDNNGIVQSRDSRLFKEVFGTSDPDADFDCNGVVEIPDSRILKKYMGKPPGPSGVVK